MDKNNSKKENRSMYLYTALIFVVALLLILVAFFSQTNVSKLGKRADEFATSAPAVTEAPSQNDEELAKLANMASELDAENSTLKTQLAVYDNLLSANAYLSNGSVTDAETIFLTIDEASLTDNQRILYEEIKNKINEGKEQ